MSENTQNQNNQNTDRNDRSRAKVAPVAYNNAGKTLVSGTIVLTVNEVRNEIFKLAKTYFEGLTLDRISVSLVPDRNSTKYDKATKTSRPTMMILLAIYFDKNDVNFVSPVDNVFSPMVKANSESANKFIRIFGAKDENDGDRDGRPFQPITIQKGYDGKTYRCLVLDVESIFVHIADGDGYGYEQRYGEKPPKVKITMTPMINNQGGESVLEGFSVTKSLATATKTSFNNFKATKIRGRVPRI